MPASAIEPIEVSALSVQLRLSITRLARQLRQTAEADLTPTQLSVLATVAHHGPLTLGELAERERVAAPTITKVTGVLVKRGLIARVADPIDRRFVRVEPTIDGAALLERTRSKRTAWLTERLRTLQPEQLATLNAAAVVLDELAQGTGGR